VQTPLCLRERSATDFIPTGVHPRELNFNWLSKINVSPISTELALLQKNAELEKENKKLRKEVLDKSYCCLSTSHQHKQCWKKPELERKICLKAMKLSRKK